MCSLDPEKLKQSEMYNFKKKIRDVKELGKQVIEYIEDIGQKGECPNNAIDENGLNTAFTLTKGKKFKIYMSKVSNANIDPANTSENVVVV